MIFQYVQFTRVFLTVIFLGGALLCHPSPFSAETVQKSDPSLLYRESWRTAFNGMVYVDDIDGDDTDEFLYWEVNREEADSITYYDENLQNIKTWFSPYIGNAFVYVTNWDALKGKEIIVSKKIQNRAFISLHSIENDSILILSFEALIGQDTDNSGSWDGSVIPRAAIDINGDGYQDIICAVNSYQDKEPRGIHAFDIKNEATLWRYPTDAIVEDIILADLINQDGTLEILCATSLPPDEHNGHSSVIVLSFTGQLLREIEPGDKLSGGFVAVKDVDHDDIPDIILCTYPEQPNVEEETSDKTNQIIIYNSQGVPQDSHTVSSMVSSLHLQDIMGDEKPEIIVGTEDGYIRIFDCHLHPVHESKTLSDIDYTLIDDFNKDGRPEIIISSHDPDRIIPYSTEFQTVILNTELEPIAQYSHGGQPFVLKGPRNRLLLLSDSELSILSPGKSPYALTLRNLILVIGLSVLLFVLIVYVILKRGRQYPILSRLRDDIVDDVHFGLILLNAEGEIVNLNESVSNMLGLEKNRSIGKRYDAVLKSEKTGELHDVIGESLAAPTNKGKRRDMKLKVGGDGREIFTEIIPLIDQKNNDLGRFIILQDITELSHSRRITEWGAMAQDLAHKIKNPLSPMRLALQRMQTVAHQTLGQEASKFDRYIELNLNEISRLIKMTDSFMKFANLKPPSYHPTDINRLTQDVAEKYIDSSSDKIKLNLDLEADLPHIKADQEQIENILVNLISNALAAIETQGSINISTSFVQRFQEEATQTGVEEYILIEVSDTGCGIPPHEINRIFEPFHSNTEGGTGLGLTFVKKIVSDHKGTITVESTEGVGTTFAISIPVK